MSLTKRLTTSVNATLERAVEELESHDAIIEADIKQTRQSVAKTQARLVTLHQQQTAFKTQFKLATEHIATWEQRATSLCKNNGHKALQCLTRRNQSEAEARRLTQSMKQQSKLIDNVTINLNTLKCQLNEMDQCHNSLRSRQTVADVNRVIKSTGKSHKIDKTFGPWDAAFFEAE